MNEKINNPYLISFTAGGLLYEETISLLPYLNDDRIELITEQVSNNSLLQTNSQAARQRILQEIRKRYHAVGGDNFTLFESFTQNERNQKKGAARRVRRTSPCREHRWWRHTRAIHGYFARLHGGLGACRPGLWRGTGGEMLPLGTPLRRALAPSFHRVA